MVVICGERNGSRTKTTFAWQRHRLGGERILESKRKTVTLPVDDRRVKRTLRLSETKKEEEKTRKQYLNMKRGSGPAFPTQKPRGLNLKVPRSVPDRQKHALHWPVGTCSVRVSFSVCHSLASCASVVGLSPMLFLFLLRLLCSF